MQIVMLESPYRGNNYEELEGNIEYARQCMADSLGRGEAPLASHLLYTQEGILDDKDPVERKAGIEAGLAWGHVAELIIFYTDRGWSTAMMKALDYYKNLGKTIVERSIL